MDSVEINVLGTGTVRALLLMIVTHSIARFDFENRT